MASFTNNNGAAEQDCSAALLLFEGTDIHAPQILILAGPNGAGKSTSAHLLVRDKSTFVNADDIARELPDSDRNHAEIKAGRLALAMLGRMGSQRQNIALETTLASRTLSPRIQELKASGYQFQLIFFWLPNPELAIQRVASRVRMGGHDIPESTIRRRYLSGLENFFQRYRPIADVWRVYANLNLQAPVLVADGRLSDAVHVYDQTIWGQMQMACGDEANRIAVGDMLADCVQITSEIAHAVQLALSENKAKNNGVAIWEDDQVKIVSPCANAASSPDAD